MGSYGKFQSDNKKYSQDRYDINNPEFNSAVSSRGREQSTKFMKNIHKWKDFIGYMKFFPDAFYDLIRPEIGGMRLDLDQRMILRSLTRFTSTYLILPRGAGKSLLAIMAIFHTAIFYPNISLSFTAQTKENSARVCKEKVEEILNFFPLLNNEITSAKFGKDYGVIQFTSGSKIDALANSQSSKGLRRRRLNIDEAALLDDELFQDALKPIVNIPRKTVGPKNLVDPEEMHSQINFYSTPSFRGTPEFERNLRMVEDMRNCKGRMVYGSDWRLHVHCGRGETKADILRKKEESSAIAFQLNHLCYWPGSAEGALVQINKLLDLRTLSKPELKGDGKSEYYISFDIARSVDSNAESSIAVLKCKRDQKMRITKMQLVNLINLPKGLTFQDQTIELKRVNKLFEPKAIIVDGVSMGQAVIDLCLTETSDPDTGESLGCWNTMNTDATPEISGAEKILFDLKAQGINSDIIVTFIDAVESKKLQLLKKADISRDINELRYYEDEYLANYQTDFFIEEVANLRLKTLSQARFGLESIVRKIGRDRFSAVSYGIFYIMEYENDYYIKDDSRVEDYLFIN